MTLLNLIGPYLVQALAIIGLIGGLGLYGYQIKVDAQDRQNWEDIRNG